MDIDVLVRSTVEDLTKSLKKICYVEKVNICKNYSFAEFVSNEVFRFITSKDNQNLSQEELRLFENLIESCKKKLNKEISLWELIEKNPDIPWDWVKLSKNINATMDVINKYQRFPWVWEEIYSKNPNLTIDMVILNPSVFWNFTQVFSIANINFEFIKKYSENINVKDLVVAIFSNINVSMECINDFLDYLWNRINDEEKKTILDVPYGFCITMNILEENIDKPWNWNLLSSHPNISMEFIEKHIDKDWNWNEISKNPNLTIEFVNKYSDEMMFDYTSVVGNQSIKPEETEEFLDYSMEYNNNVNYESILEIYGENEKLPPLYERKELDVNTEIFDYQTEEYKSQDDNLFE